VLGSKILDRMKRFSQPPCFKNGFATLRTRLKTWYKGGNAKTDSTRSISHSPKMKYTALHIGGGICYREWKVMRPRTGQCPEDTREINCKQRGKNKDAEFES
jgi:hypothetical protein